jgi:acyl carrier protein
MQSTSTVRDHVRSLVIDAAPIEVGQITPETTLTDDLGYDSLSVLELVNLLENAFDLPTVPDSMIADVTTISDVENLVLRIVDEWHGGAAG